MTATTRMLVGLLACASFPALAVEVQEGKLSINGFGSWGYGASTGGNSYDLAQPDGHFEDGEFTVAMSSRLSERAVAAAQLHFEVDAGFQIDYVFGEWRFGDLARLRVGLVKHPFGIFGEVPRVGTLRPFFLLPSGIYGDTEMTGSGVRGASLSGSWPSGPWRLSYDVYGGSIVLPVSEVVDKLAPPGTLTPGGVLGSREEETRYVLGGRLILGTALDGLDFRLSAYGSPFRDPNSPRAVIGPSVQYVGPRLTARAEYFFLVEQGRTQRDHQRTHGAYAEAAWFFTERVQLGARAEIFQLRLVGVSGGSPFEHRELAGTFNYWLDPGLVLKVSLHAIDGNRFAHPLAFDDAVLGGHLQRRTLAGIAGMQFSF